MTNLDNAVRFAALMIVFASVAIYFIDDWQPDFPFWSNVFAGHVSVGGRRISVSLIVMLASLASCWAAIVAYMFPDQ